VTDVTERIMEQYHDLREKRVEEALKSRFDGWIEFQKPAFVGRSRSSGEMVVSMNFALHKPGVVRREYPDGEIVRIGPWGLA